MSPRSKREYVEAVHVRYKKASRKDKTIILDEFCVPLLAITASMPFDGSAGSSVSPNPGPGHEGDVPSIAAPTFSYP